jgi:hypothetical protein
MAHRTNFIWRDSNFHPPISFGPIELIIILIVIVVEQAVVALIEAQEK